MPLMYSASGQLVCRIGPHQGVQQGLTLVVEDADLDDLIFRWMQARGFQVEVDGLHFSALPLCRRGLLEACEQLA
jgi:hypothetical protein